MDELCHDPQAFDEQVEPLQFHYLRTGSDYH